MLFVCCVLLAVCVVCYSLLTVGSLFVVVFAVCRVVYCSLLIVCGCFVLVLFVDC